MATMPRGNTVNDTTMPEGSPDLDLTVEEADDMLEQEIANIKKCAGVKGSKPSVLQSLASLQKVVPLFGMLPEHLTKLLDVILSAKVDDISTRKLIKVLLPRYSVPEECAVKILGALGRHLGFLSQAALLKWIILVYDYLDSRVRLQRLYGVVFHYLTYESLRSPLCHLLYYMTRRENVKPFRVRKLMDLQMTVGKEKELMGLLHVYKSYFPDLILMPMPLSNSAIFKSPDQTTATTILELQERWRDTEPGGIRSSQRDGGDISLSKGPLMRAGLIKRNRKVGVAAIPDSYTIYSQHQYMKNPNQNGRQQPHQNPKDRPIPLSQITSLTTLVKHIDTLALPDQFASILSNRLLQQVICLQPSKSAIDRISYWLGQELMDLWHWCDKSESSRARFGDMLRKVVDMTMVLKDLLPVLESFLTPFLRTWNGEDYKKEIFTLLTYIRPRSFEDIYTYFLRPLQRLFAISGPLWKGELILCYTKLLQRWAQLDWHDYLTNRGQGTEGDDQQARDRRIRGRRNVIQGTFSELDPQVDYMETLHAFILHVDRISSVGLQMEADDIAVQHGVLSFFDLVSTLAVTFHVPMVVIIPDSTTVYRLFFSNSGMALSRICGVIEQYKAAFEAYETYEMARRLKQEKLDADGDDAMEDIEMEDGLAGMNDAVSATMALMPEGYSREYVGSFNSFIMDICNFVWRNRAFNKSSKNAKGFQVDADTIAQASQICKSAMLNSNNLFSLTHSIPMAGYSARFVKLLESRALIPKSEQLSAPISQTELTRNTTQGKGLQISFQDFQAEYLDYLEQEMGFDGLAQFLLGCITTLLARRLEKQGVQVLEDGME